MTIFGPEINNLHSRNIYLFHQKRKQKSRKTLIRNDYQSNYTLKMTTLSFQTKKKNDYQRSFWKIKVECTYIQRQVIKRTVFCLISLQLMVASHLPV